MNIGTSCYILLKIAVNNCNENFINKLQDEDEGDKSSDEEFERQLAEALSVADQEKAEKANKKPKIKQGRGRKARKKRKTIDPNADGYEVSKRLMAVNVYTILKLKIAILSVYYASMLRWKLIHY